MSGIIKKAAKKVKLKVMRSISSLQTGDLQKLRNCGQQVLISTGACYTTVQFQYGFPFQPILLPGSVIGYPKTQLDQEPPE